MPRKTSSFRLVAGLVMLAAFVFTALQGCGGSSSPSVPSGTLQVGLTDAPSPAYASVVVAIKEVRAVPAGLEGAADTDARLPVIVTYSTPLVVDVLTLRFQQEVLGSVPVPAGAYSQIRLVLAANPNGQGQPPVNYVTLASDPATKIPLKTPSGQESGLKILGNFQVTPGTINAILLDFDPTTAIVVAGNSGQYLLKPTGIRIMQPSSPLATTFGSVSGTVVSSFKDWSSATVTVVPQSSVTPIAAGTIFSNFTSGLWQTPFSAFVPGGTYRVHVTAKGFAPYSSPLTSVASGAETTLGEIYFTAP